VFVPFFNQVKEFSMSMSIGGVSASPVSATGVGSTKHTEAAAFRQLNSSLQQGDLDDAKQAYAAIVKNAPSGVTWNPDGPFAALGKALQAGDVQGAQSAMQQMVQNAREKREGSTDPVPPVVTASSTGGIAGSTLSVSA
jgi:DNA-binding FadR family transcriptional regulator